MQTHSSLFPVIALQASLINAHAVGINALGIFRQFQKIAKKCGLHPKPTLQDL